MKYRWINQRQGRFQDFVHKIQIIELLIKQSLNFQTIKCIIF